MEQRIAELEQKVTQLTDTFVKFMNIPYKNQKEIIARLMPLLEMYEKKEGPFVEKKKHTRRPLNKADWSRVQACLNDEGGAASWSEVAKASGVPASTARKYAKMTPDEVAALPEGINFEEEVDEGEE
jgi:hypothetical protein